MALPARNRRDDVATWPHLAELERTTQRLASLLDQAWGAAWPPPVLRDAEGFVPLADLEETDEAYVVELELPGVRKKDVTVEVAGRRLSVTGERKERERAGILRRRTRSVGGFTYDVVLPGDIDEDAISADLLDGVLTVTVPKAESERRRSRRIPVT